MHLRPIEGRDGAVDDGVERAGCYQMNDHFGIGCRLEQAAALHQLASQCDGIGQIAVMSDRKAA